MAQVSSIATGESATCWIVRVGDTLHASNAGSVTVPAPSARGHRRRVIHRRKNRPRRHRTKSMNHLDDKTALITGGGRGIGRAIALQLAQRGARVAVAARSEDELVETTSAIAALGGRAHAIVADLATPGAGTALARRALDELGRVDILINNAAVVAPLGASTGIDVEAFARAFTVNVTSVAELTFALVSAMVERRWGRVVNVSSGIVAAPAAMVGANAYAATKAAIEAHTVNLAAELAGTGVTVNAYRPGSVDTAMQAWIRDHDCDAIGRVLRDRFTERHAAGDLIAPEASAAALTRRLAEDATGEIRDVADDTATPSPSTGGATTRLSPGDTFPSLTITPADGHRLELPGALAGHFGVVLLYRGGWCPYCVAQLRAFRRAADRLADLDIRVVALSVDDEATTRQTIAEHRLDFPVGHSADADTVAAATGAFVNDAPRYLQSTGLVLDREGRVIVSVYSSGAIGRLVPDDVIGLIKYVRGQEPHEEAA
jgi:NAD(P)-dependent dehydrogenase (short-subunit alcohol dehydrogenase family)/peroxiredoxin